MAHDTGDADIGDEHYDQGIPYGDHTRDCPGGTH